MPSVTKFPRVDDKMIASRVNKNWSVGKQDLEELRDIFGKLDTNTEVDQIYSQEQYYGTINDALAERVAQRFEEKIYGLLKNDFWSPYTHHLLPIRQVGHNESTEIEWNSWNFNEGIADLVAPLGIPRIYSHERSKHSATMLRRGCGIFIESGFFTSPEGRRRWNLQIAQLASVTQKTLEFDTMAEFIEVWSNQPKRSFQLGFMVDDQNVGDTYLDFLVSDIEQFGIVNKTPDSRGLINLVNRYREFMEMIGDGRSPDTLILPPNLQSFYYMNNDDLWRYNTAGPTMLANQRKALETPQPNGKGLSKFMNFDVIDTKVYRSTTQSNREAGDLLTTRRQIGEWYPMVAKDVWGDLSDYENYNPRHRNIQIHSMEQDMFGVVKFLDVIKHCGRWDPKTGGWSDRFDTFRKGYIKGPGDPHPDTFLTEANGGYDFVQSWGQIDAEHLNVESIERMAYTYRKAGITDEDYKNFKVDEAAVPIKNTDLKLVNATLQDVAKKVLNLRVDLQTIEWMFNNGIHVPLAGIVCRPNMTFNVSSGFMTIAGSETGANFIGHQDFQMSNNSIRKAIGGSWTFFSKAVIFEPRNVMCMEDFFVQKYIRGANLSFYNDDDILAFQEHGGVVSGDNSILAMIVSENQDFHNLNKRNILDIRGFNTGLRIDGKALFKDALFYSNLLGVEDTFVHNPAVDGVDFHNMQYKPNTICCRGFYEYGRDFDHFKINTGHLGPCIYDGVARAFDGHNFVSLKEYYGSKMRAQKRS